MIIKPDGTIRFLSLEEHLQRKTLVYQDQHHTIRFSSNKKFPFVTSEGNGQEMYIDLFALHFGQKEQASRRTGKGFVPICYGCERRERDRMLYLPVEEVVDKQTRHPCVEGCHYYSPPVGVHNRYVLNCILARYRAFGILDFKCGLTLEEVGRIYACTRERIRQIEEHALHKMRHVSRQSKLQAFFERLSEYRDYNFAPSEQLG